MEWIVHFKQQWTVPWLGLSGPSFFLFSLSLYLFSLSKIDLDLVQSWTIKEHYKHFDFHSGLRPTIAFWKCCSQHMACSLHAVDHNFSARSWPKIPPSARALHGRNYFRLVRDHLRNTNANKVSIALTLPGWQSILFKFPNVLTEPLRKRTAARFLAYEKGYGDSHAVTHVETNGYCRQLTSWCVETSCPYCPKDLNCLVLSSISKRKQSPQCNAKKTWLRATTD